MEIAERTVSDVTVLDLKGKMTLGEGDELLKDKINSLLAGGKKKLVLNLEGVPYIDSAGLGEIVRTLHDGEPSGRQPQAAQPDQAHRGPAVHHEAADGVRDVRHGSRGGQELHRLSSAWRRGP